MKADQSQPNPLTEPQDNNEASQATLFCDGIFHAARIVHALGGIENLQAYDVTILVIVENDAGLVLVTLLDLCAAKYES